MTNPPPESRVRGSVVLGILHFLETDLSPRMRETALKELPDPWGERFAAGRVLASEKVPLAVVNRLCAAAARAKGEDVVDFSERAGAFAAREGIASVFRPFFRILSVSNAIAIAPMMWGHVHDPGKLTVEVRGKTGKAWITDYAGDLSGCARTAAWFKTIMELSGARSVTLAHPRCAVRKDPEEVWTFAWE